MPDNVGCLDVKWYLLRFEVEAFLDKIPGVDLGAIRVATFGSQVVPQHWTFIRGYYTLDVNSKEVKVKSDGRGVFHFLGKILVKYSRKNDAIYTRTSAANSSPS